MPTFLKPAVTCIQKQLVLCKHAKCTHLNLCQIREVCKFICTAHFQHTGSFSCTLNKYMFDLGVYNKRHFNLCFTLTFCIPILILSINFSDLLCNDGSLNTCLTFIYQYFTLFMNVIVKHDIHISLKNAILNYATYRRATYFTENILTTII